MHRIGNVIDQADVDLKIPEALLQHKRRFAPTDRYFNQAKKEDYI